MSELDNGVPVRGLIRKDKTFMGMGRWVGEMFRSAKKNAGRRSISFDLSRREFRAMVLKADGRCMITGIQFDFNNFEGSCRRPFAPSLDRIDSTRGYTDTNCRLVCVIVNLAMNQWGMAPLMLIAENLVARKQELQDMQFQRGPYRPLGFQTVQEFLSDREIEVSPLKLANRVSRICRSRKVEPLQIPNVRVDGTPGFGGVNAYPTAFLHEALGAFQ